MKFKKNNKKKDTPNWLNVPINILKWLNILKYQGCHSILCIKKRDYILENDFQILYFKSSKFV